MKEVIVNWKYQKKIFGFYKAGERQAQPWRFSFSFWVYLSERSKSSRVTEKIEA
jgi:hypothetical protein